MEKTLIVINHLEDAGIIGKYAIAGAVAATRYIEPIQTYDLDLFIMLPHSVADLISLQSLYDYCKQRGYELQGECIAIEGWPVQFLPVYNKLTEEALLEAHEVKFGETPTRVLRAEYLAAIMLDTGRPKDHARLVQFVESEAFELKNWENVIARHNLSAKWEVFQQRFLLSYDKR